MPGPTQAPCLKSVVTKQNQDIKVEGRVALRSRTEQGGMGISGGEDVSPNVLCTCETGKNKLKSEFF